MSEKSVTPVAPAEKVNLYQRINAVRASIGYLQKDKEVGEGKDAYKAVTHDAVIGQIRQFLIEQGVIIIPTLVTSMAHPKEVDADMKVSKQFRYDATYSFRFVNADDPEDHFDMVIEAHAMDNADKAPGKALSYSMKMAILKVFNLETGENEESRYDPQEDPKVLAILLRSIEACSDEASLEKAYSAAWNEVSSQSDQKAIIEAVKVKRGALKKGKKDA